MYVIIIIKGVSAMKRVLWTGGWDSTFRILDLVLNHKQRVKPYYVLDFARKSTQVEIETMEKIKRMVVKKDPSTDGLIEDTTFIKREDIPDNETLNSYYRNLRTIAHIGDQYLYIAKYIAANNLTELELSVHRDDKAEFFIKNDVQLIKEGNDAFYRLVENLSNPNLELFSYYTFPLLNMTKLEMAEKAKDGGFSHIMEETWFCYNPLKDGKPCGVCNPCKYTKEEGLGRRIPKVTLYRRFQVFMLKAKHRLKNM